VKVSIKGSSDRQKSMETVLSHLVSEVKNRGEMNQKVVKPDSIKFNLKPTPAAKDYKDDGVEEFEDIDQITKGKDLMSEEFEAELQESIRHDKSRLTKKWLIC